MDLADSLSPRSLYTQMEGERELKSGTGVRELFAPLFLAKLLKEYLAKKIPLEKGHANENPNGKNNCNGAGPSRGSNSGRNNNGDVLNGETNGYWNWDATANNEANVPLSNNNVPVEDTFFLGNDIRVDVEKILRFGQVLHSTKILNLNKFCQHFCEQVKSPPLELIWLMDAKYDLLSTTSYLIMLTQKEYFFASTFSHQFLSFCFSPSLLDANSRGNSVDMLEHFFEALVRADECNNDASNQALVKIKNYSQGILHQITMRLISDDSDVQDHVHEFILRNIISFPTSGSLKQRYFLRQLQCILSQKSVLTPELVIQQQENLSKLSTNRLKVNTIKMFIEPPQSPSKVLAQIFTKIRKAELINWENTLLLVGLWEKLYSKESDSVRFFKENIKKLMFEGFEENRRDKVLASFILARHCSLIAPETFFRYEKWYNSIFGSEQVSPVRELHVFSFFTEFLSQLVPVEPPCFLQVQVAYWPYIPPAPGCRTIWSEYISAAKARIQEYNDINGLMEFELSVNNPLQRDVDMAIKSFSNVSKTPQIILEMIMFRKKYYVEQFLPTLLKKPVGVSHSDARLRLIALLNSEARIPSDLFLKYKSGGFSSSSA